MIICGDFAYPFNESDVLQLDNISADFIAKAKIVNFESTLSSINSAKVASGIAVSSSDKCFDVLSSLNVVGLTLSNNHILDFSYKPSELFSKFDDRNLKYTGLGADIGEAKTPILFGEYLILNFGWETIGCKPARRDTLGCNPLEYTHVKSVVLEALHDNPTLKIVVIFHWNYEFEGYPQPAHRMLAKELIDMGVESIIGHHSHIIQGAELYKGKAIIYGLGNFYLPKFNYSGYYLDFPEVAYTGLAIDITNLDSYSVFSHNNELVVKGPIPLFENEDVKKVSGFSGLNDAEYLSFFKENRLKRKLLPIYKSWGMQSYINDKFVQFRQVMIDFLVRSNLKKHRK
ncbi:CapA family protein [Vibrio scophthalmi]|uniref:CapA family protein n=1 Tax=Vibrio scophthalmi TaxID=45658 RepID=UPI00349F2E44